MNSELDIFIWLIESFLMIALLSFSIYVCTAQHTHTHSFFNMSDAGSFNVIFDYFHYYLVFSLNKFSKNVEFFQGSRS